MLKQNVQKSFHFTARQRLIQVRKEICNDYSLINLHCLKCVKVNKVYFKSSDPSSPVSTELLTVTIRCSGVRSVRTEQCEQRTPKI